MYWLSSQYIIIIDSNKEYYIILCENSDENFKTKFLRSLNDYSLRDLISEKTKDIKNLVITKAFYPDLLEFKPIGNFDDPIDMEINEAK